MKINYLQAMGITNWRLRDSKSMNYYLLVDSAGRPQCTVIAKVNSDDEFHLLKNIARALHFTCQQSDQSLKTERVILLGQSHQTPEIKDIRVCSSYSLVEILTNPLLKSELWRQLTSFIAKEVG